MDKMEELFSLSDLLFELSNDIRFDILKLIKDKPKRPSVIATQLDLSPPEVSRNFSRLNDSRLITKDVDNHYSITNFGEHVLHILEELEFINKHQDYFISHSSVKIPLRFQKRISELSNYSMINTFMEFVTGIKEIIEESKSFIWFFIDQYPLIALDGIRSSLERGVKIKIIEQRELLGPQIMFEKKYLNNLNGLVPGVQIRIQEECNVYLIVSDAGGVVAFSTSNGFDYSGFLYKGKNESSWSYDLFSYYWENSEKVKLSDLIETQDSIELSNTTNTRKRGDEWVNLFSRLNWSE